MPAKRTEDVGNEDTQSHTSAHVAAVEYWTASLA